MNFAIMANFGLVFGYFLNLWADGVTRGGPPEFNRNYRSIVTCPLHTQKKDGLKKNTFGI